MYFNVSGLLRGRVGGTRRFHFSGERLDYSGMSFWEIDARGMLTRTDRTVLVEVSVGATCEVECARCLSDAEVRLTVEFAEEFVPANLDLVARRWKGWVGDDSGDELRIDERNILDLSVPLWQSLRAGMPMVALCFAGCKGICAKCYVDLNFGKCGCDTIDSIESDSRASSRL